MDNTSIDWDELVDLYVDNECSEEERRLVEAQAERDESVAAAIEAALRIRKGIAAMRAELPAGFVTRLQQAIADAPDSAPRVLRAGLTQKRSLLFSRVTIGAAASVAIVVGSVAFFASASRSIVNEPIPRDDGFTMAAAETISAPVADMDAREPYIGIPLSEGGTPESVSKRESQNAIWVDVVLKESSNLRKQLGEFQRTLGKQNLNFIKCGNDCEYVLQGVDAQQWEQVAQALGGYGETKVSNALTSWREGKDNAPVSVRVVFKTAVDEGKQERGESFVE